MTAVKIALIGIPVGGRRRREKKYKGYLTIFIYDTAKGGAGYASQFNIHTEEILAQALKILENCSCQIACTKC